MLVPRLDQMGLVCVDPAAPHVKRTGTAYFEAGRLVWCDLIVPPQDEWRFPDVLLCEFPQIYPGPQKEDPNDLLQVARTVGLVEENQRAARNIRVLPREWKGTVDKKIHNARVLARLTPDERAVHDKLDAPASKKHNVIDAIGLGLWALDRMGSQCVPSALAWSKGKL